MCRVLPLVLLWAAALGAQAPARPTASTYLSHVRYLSSDQFNGRGNGTPDLERAADYIAAQFRAAGLAGGAGPESFDQAFDTEVQIEPPSTAALLLDAGGTTHTFGLGVDYYPLSTLDRLPGAPPPTFDDVPLVFAGYGISAPGLGYDDYAGIDVRGAAVLVLTHEPQENDERSIFDGRNLTPSASISEKAREARERGARLLLVVEDPSHVDDRAMRGVWWADPQRDTMGIPVLRVARERLARAVPALDLDAAAYAIDRTLAPASRRLDGLTLDYVEHRAQFTARVRNVVGVLRGADPSLAHEAVVVGAHYDHVGTGGEFSQAPEATGDIHNGADDNASGTAALIEMARVAGATRERFRRTVVFVAFAGEELGLRGSRHYVQHPAVPLDRTVAMVNLDMVGRARGRVLVGAFGWREGFPAFFRRMRSWTRLRLEDFLRGGGYQADQSDGAPFAARGVPAIAFFTGFHADYHRPSDDWGRIDAQGGAEVARLALRVVEELARQKASTGR
ncbi:MAG: M20/M25/M40 family metallo-hydrolase [Vicinamibacterales bacterium]